MSDVHHPLFARLYRRLAANGEKLGLRELRIQLLSGLVGTVVEVGAGDGANFRHYPETVTDVVALEPEPYLRGHAETAARSAPVPIGVVDGVADDLPLPDGSVDAVVFCLVLCSVPDQHAALTEARRVLRPGGELRFLEHVRVPRPGAGQRIQIFLDRFAWPWLFGGCHCGRDTVSAIGGTGFTITELERSLFPAGTHTPVSPHVRGRALRD